MSTEDGMQFRVSMEVTPARMAEALLNGGKYGNAVAEKQALLDLVSELDDGLGEWAFSLSLLALGLELGDAFTEENGSPDEIEEYRNAALNLRRVLRAVHGASDTGLKPSL